MSNDLATIEHSEDVAEKEYVLMEIASQKFAMPVEQIEDVLRGRGLTQIPLAPPQVAGVLNLRGKIVTAVDMKIRLGFEPYEDYSKCMSAVSNIGGQYYCLLVDNVSEVMKIPDDGIKPCPSNIDSRLLDVATGVYRMPDRLLFILDVNKVLA